MSYEEVLAHTDDGDQLRHGQFVSGLSSADWVYISVKISHLERLLIPTVGRGYILTQREFVTLSCQALELEQTMSSSVTAAALLLALRSANALVLPDNVVGLHSSRVTRPTFLSGVYESYLIPMISENREDYQLWVGTHGTPTVAMSMRPRS